MEYNIKKERMLQERGRYVRKTDICLGIFAGFAGIVLAALSMLEILPYNAAVSANTIYIFGIILIGANIIGIIGALLIKKNNLLGSAVMAAVTIIIMIFGFPWQSLAAVVYIMSVVMAAVPEKPAQ